MVKTVKVTVTDQHFKTKYNLSSTVVRQDTVSEVELSPTVRNAVHSGTLQLVEGSLTPESDEKEFQGDDESGEEGEGVDEFSEPLNEKTKKELKSLCEDRDLKKSGKKAELIERLKKQ